MRKLNTVKAVVLGHAVGDALGVPVEFCSREELRRHPVTTLQGYGTYPFPAGTWSDDTSMSLCAMDALSRHGWDPDAVMKNFEAWYREGAFTPTGEMFDVGNTCSIAIERYAGGGVSALSCGDESEHANGNGSLMRIHPFVLYRLQGQERLSANALHSIMEISGITHRHPRAMLGCGIYACILEALLQEPSHSAVRRGLSRAWQHFAAHRELSHYRRLFSADFPGLPEEEIQSSGYVVHTLEAAVWCLLTTQSYRDCVLRAVNLGEDTDTVAAVAGGLAGALYGYRAIPTAWRGGLLRCDYLTTLCERFVQ